MNPPRPAPSALVTGASGFIGGRLAHRLVEAGWSVGVLARQPERLAQPLVDACRVFVGDLGNHDTLAQAVTGARVVFHCAANVNTWDTRESYHRANVQGVENLLNAIARHNPSIDRLVHLSTVDVYGYPSTPCDESAPTGGGGFAYGESKLEGESVLRSLAGGSKIVYTILRPCNVIGPGSQFITRIGAGLRSGLMLTIDGGRANAGVIHVDNLVDYMLRVAASPQAVDQCYNVRDDYDIAWKDFLDRFRAAIDGKGLLVDLPFGVADGVARCLEIVHRGLFPGREPLLHRLLVRIFGRTCGHSADKIRRDFPGPQGLDMQQALHSSFEWYARGH